LHNRAYKHSNSLLPPLDPQGVDAKVKPQLRCNKSVKSYKLTDIQFVPIIGQIKLVHRSLPNVVSVQVCQTAPP
jgi:hypothetical protein